MAPFIRVSICQVLMEVVETAQMPTNHRLLHKHSSRRTRR
jgi:hypothetical protein